MGTGKMDVLASTCARATEENAAAPAVDHGGDGGGASAEKGTTGCGSVLEIVVHVGEVSEGMNYFGTAHWIVPNDNNNLGIQVQ